MQRCRSSCGSPASHSSPQSASFSPFLSLPSSLTSVPLRGNTFRAQGDYDVPLSLRPSVSPEASHADIASLIALRTDDLCPGSDGAQAPQRRPAASPPRVAVADARAGQLCAPGAWRPSIQRRCLSSEGAPVMERSRLRTAHPSSIHRLRDPQIAPYSPHHVLLRLALPTLRLHRAAAPLARPHPPQHSHHRRDRLPRRPGAVEGRATEGGDTPEEVGHRAARTSAGDEDRATEGESPACGVQQGAARAAAGGAGAGRAARAGSGPCGAGWSGAGRSRAVAFRRGCDGNG